MVRRREPFDEAARVATPRNIRAETRLSRTSNARASHAGTTCALHRAPSRRCSNARDPSRRCHAEPGVRRVRPSSRGSRPARAAVSVARRSRCSIARDARSAPSPRRCRRAHPTALWHPTVLPCAPREVERVFSGCPHDRNRNAMRSALTRRIDRGSKAISAHRCKRAFEPGTPVPWPSVVHDDSLR